MDCSKTEIFLEEWARMCKMCAIKVDSCEECLIFNEENVFTNPKKSIALVQKWSDEHPRKTRQSEFLKVFPNMLLDNAGVSIICPKSFEGERFECPKIRSSDSTVMSVCDKCGKEYWLSEVE